MLLPSQLKNPHFYFMVICDALIFVVSLIFAYLLRFEFYLNTENIYKVKALLLWIVPLKTSIFAMSGMYVGMWRYTGLTDLWNLAKACLLSSLLILAIILYAERFEGYSRAVFVADAIITLLLAGGLRLAIRLAFSFHHGYDFAAESKGIVTKKKCLIIGAGDAGEQILREILGNKKLYYDVIGFIDDDPAKKGRSIHNVRVLGSVSEIPSIAKKKAVEEMLIAIPSASGEQIRRIVEACASCGLPYKTLPSLGELIDGRASVKVLRDIDYEDLLGRSIVRLNTEDIRNYIENKSVLITGCGGSIGSELCRQVIKYNPRFLTLLDASEANLLVLGPRK